MALNTNQIVLIVLLVVFYLAFNIVGTVYYDKLTKNTPPAVSNSLLSANLSMMILGWCGMFPLNLTSPITYGVYYDEYQAMEVLSNVKESQTDNKSRADIRHALRSTPVSHLSRSEAAAELVALVKEIAHHDFKYYTANHPDIPDAAYDALKARKAEIRQKFPGLQKKAQESPSPAAASAPSGRMVSQELRAIPVEHMTREQAEKELQSLVSEIALHDLRYYVFSAPEVPDQYFDMLKQRKQAIRQKFQGLAKKSSAASSAVSSAPPAVPVSQLTPAQAAQELVALVKQIALHDFKYYTENMPEISNAAYDALKARKAEIRQKFPGLQKKLQEPPSKVAAVAPSGRAVSQQLRHVPVEHMTREQAQQELKSLVSEIALHDMRYYVLSAPEVPDQYFDALKQRKQAIRQKFPGLAKK